MGCAGGNNPGIEYAPDMYDSKGYEPYNQLDSNVFNKLGSNLRKPADGSVAYGKQDYSYHLTNNGEGYEKSATEVLRPSTLIDENCEGKRLYGIYCTPCHGKEGNNDGNVFKKASYLKPAWKGYSDEYITNLPDGKIYHTLVYGKNNMGSHSSVLTPEERWFVIDYVRQLSNGIFECEQASVMNGSKSNMGEETSNILADTILQIDFEKVEIDAEVMNKINENLSKVEFENSRSTLNTNSTSALDNVATLLTANEGLRIIIEGYTDNSGDRVQNMVLSKQRANAVKEYLIGKGYDASRFITNGFGSGKLLNNSETDQAKAESRNITFTFIK